MKNNIFLILLLILVGSSSLNAQSDTDYKPLLELGKKWTQGLRTVKEFINIWTYDVEIQNKLTVQDTLFYKIYVTGEDWYLREDTVEKKVYSRHNITDTEELIYNFSLEVGDIFNNHFYVDSIKNIEYFGAIKKTFYMHDISSGGSNIWIEGVGALSGILSSDEIYQGYLEGYGMNCCYLNDSLLYQNPYGCSGEKKPPRIMTFSICPDTVKLNSSLELFAAFSHDYSFSIFVTLISPGGDSITVDNFNIVGDNEIIGYNIYECRKTFQSFNNEIGDWYVYRIKAVDINGNVAENFYPQDNKWTRFHVTKPINIKDNNNDTLSIFYNSQQKIIQINQISPINSKFQLYDCTGKLILSKQILNSKEQISINNLQPAVYICKIYNNKKIQTKKIIIQ